MRKLLIISIFICNISGLFGMNSVAASEAVINDSGNVHAFISKDHPIAADKDKSKFMFSEVMINGTSSTIDEHVREEFIDAYTVTAEELGIPAETIANSEREVEEKLRKIK